MNSIVRNERRKLFATYLNTIAAGFIVAGGVAPSVSLLFAQNPPWEPFAFFLVISISLSIMLHSIAQSILV